MSEKKSSLSVQTYFSENYDLKLALSLSKTELESKKQEVSAAQRFEHILPPFDAFEVIRERMNLFYS